MVAPLLCILRNSAFQQAPFEFFCLPPSSYLTSHKIYSKVLLANAARQGTNTFFNFKFIDRYRIRIPEKLFVRSPRRSNVPKRGRFPARGIE